MKLNPITEQIIAGKRLGREDDLSFLLQADLEELTACADRLRRHFSGDHANLCSIINGRSGRCSEDCKFCAQSAHHCTGIEEYAFLDPDKIVEACKYNESRGVHRFSIVTAGRTLAGADFDKAITAYHRMHEETNMHLCASHGLLSDAQFEALYAAGVRTYHCNIETSRRNFPHICTTHTFDDKLACIARAKKAGLSVCSGGIIGMGETWEDRLDMAVTLAEVGVSSIPLNALMPIPGTPMEHRARLTENDILRTVALFRYLNPTIHIRLAAGRALMTHTGESAFRSGANATITGDMLTTTGSSIAGDVELLTGMGFDLGREADA